MTLLAKIAGWFITSKWGLTILACIVAIAASFLTYNIVVDRAYDRGVAKCQADHIAAEALANQRQDVENAARNTAASKIANTADAAGEAATAATDVSTNSTKEVIHYVYRDLPHTKPVAIGSCVHPVDDRVQQRFNEAIRAANGQ